jgi:putative sigma-54 modulation protein
MIKTIEISGIGYEIDEATKAYIEKKISRLDRYLPKHARDSVAAKVKLKEVNKDHGNKYEAEVILAVPEKTITAKDSTVNMMAAIDIVEAKILSQIRKYKQESVSHISKRGVMSRFKRSFARENQ